MNDSTNVSDVAARLQVSEYAVFALAFRHWFGTSATEPELRIHFACYLRHGEVPHWVRHYCRFEPVPVTTPTRFHVSPTRCLAVGAYFVFSLLAACALFVFY